MVRMSALHRRARRYTEGNELSLQQDWKQTAERMAQGIRRRVLQHTLERNGGYLSQACSSAEIFAALYTKIMQLERLDAPILPGHFQGVPCDGRPAVTGAAYNGRQSAQYDRFILSPAQYALVLYAALIEAGRMDERGMEQYDKDGGCVEMIGAEHSPGMEVTTGSLGQGISQAAGIAFARKQRGDTGRVVVFLSDGECQSGQFWEAVQAMSYHRLDNMLMFVDVNGYQCDGKMTGVMNLEPFDDRLRAFGARVERVDGHDMEALVRLGGLKPDGAPAFVLCDTDPRRGVEALQSRGHKLHYVRFRTPDEREQYRRVYEAFMKGGAV